MTNLETLVRERISLFGQRFPAVSNPRIGIQTDIPTAKQGDYISFLEESISLAFRAGQEYEKELQEGQIDPHRT